MLKYLVLFGVLVLAGCSGDASTSFRIEGSDMEPTLSDGDKVEVLQFDRQVENGDILLYIDPASVLDNDRTFPANPSITFRQLAGRVIGLPGQTVDIDPETGELRLDGTVLIEPYIQGTTTCEVMCSVTVPGLIGSGRTPSASRTPFLYYSDSISQPNPCDRNTCFFVMGDNRQDERDSGPGTFVPWQNIIGFVQEP